jgi:hypothetical protein
MARFTQVVACGAVAALAISACGGGPGASSTSGTSAGTSSASSAGTTGFGTSAGTTGSSSTTGGTTSVSGGTTGQTGTSAGTTGGPQVDAGCLGGGFGGKDFQPCLATIDCACPYLCVTGTCTQPCVTTSDCEQPERSCQGGSCLDNPCSNFDAPCDAADAGDGTCVPRLASLVCRQNGSASEGGACDLAATRKTPQRFCMAGDGCSDSALCERLCDVSLGADGGCPAGEGCASLGSPPFGSTVPGACVLVGSTGCVVTGGFPEFSSCQVDADCACPEICVLDLGGVCRFPCLTSTDCAAAYESCVGGLCDVVLCGNLPDGGTNGSVGWSCTTEGTDAGTCVAAYVHSVGSCWRPGTATAGCVTVPTSWDPATACVQGSACLAALPDGGRCGAMCDPADAGSVCPTGSACDPFAFFQETIDGVCVPIGDSGCSLLQVSPPLESFPPCYADENCTCPAVCHGPTGDGGLCVVPCQTTSDCPIVATSCQAGWCLTNTCDTLGASCDAGGSEDGLCQSPLLQQKLVCLQGGTATQACDPNATRADPARLCAPPAFCDPLVDGGTCEVLCDPAGAGSCPASTVCLPLYFASGVEGACVPCVEVQGRCNGNGQCCTVKCDLNFGLCL